MAMIAGSSLGPTAQDMGTMGTGDGPNLVPDALEWENGGGVSHMPVGNVGLD